MPKCDFTKADGSRCRSNALVGTTRCQHHPSQPKAAPRIQVVRDPVDEIVDRLMALRREEDDLISRLRRMKDERDEIVEESGEELARERFGLSGEDLEKARVAAQVDFTRRIGVQQKKLENLQRELLTAPRLRYTPPRDDMIPFGGVQWGFVAGKQGKYPRPVIELAEQRWAQLDAWQGLKGRLRASGDPIRAGMEFKEQEAILESNR